MADVRPPDKMTETRAEIRLPTQDLRDDLAFFTKVLKMRLDMIYPADNPEVAVLSGYGLRLRIEKGAPEAPGTIRILTEDPDGFAGGQRQLNAPNGTRVEIDELNHPRTVLLSRDACHEISSVERFFRNCLSAIETPRLAQDRQCKVTWRSWEIRH